MNIVKCHIPWKHRRSRSAGVWWSHLIRIHTVFYFDWKSMLTTGMLQVHKMKIVEKFDIVFSWIKIFGADFLQKISPKIFNLAWSWVVRYRYSSPRSRFKIEAKLSEWVFHVSPTAIGYIEMGPWLRVSSNRLEEPGIKLGTPGYKASVFSTTPQGLLLWPKKVVDVS